VRPGIKVLLKMSRRIGPAAKHRPRSHTSARPEDDQQQFIPSSVRSADCSSSRIFDLPRLGPRAAIDSARPAPIEHAFSLPRASRPSAPGADWLRGDYHARLSDLSGLRAGEGADTGLADRRWEGPSRARRARAAAHAPNSAPSTAPQQGLIAKRSDASQQP